MYKITAKDVKALREKTGAGLMDCKKALLETGGDEKKAIEYLKKNYQPIIHMRKTWAELIDCKKALIGTDDGIHIIEMIVENLSKNQKINKREKRR